MTSRSRTCFFVASSFMGHLFHAIWDEKKGKPVVEVKGDKRAAMQEALRRGFTWSPLQEIGVDNPPRA